MTTSTSPKKIVIIGGVAGGASAAARLRRLDEHADIILIERGPDVSFANCGLPYHIGGEITDRNKLAVQTPASLRKLLNIKVMVETEAVAINREQKSVRIRHADSESDLPYDHLILSPGASPLTPPLEGIDLPGIYTLRNLQDMDRIKAAAEQATNILVIGAGFIGLEMAEQFIHLKKKVALVELVEQVLPQMDPEMVRPVEQDLLDHGVDLILGDGISAFGKSETGLTATLNSGKELQADLVVLSIGVRPESALAKDAGLELGERGHIRANAFMQTSDPAIYAVGDVCETEDPIVGGYASVPLGGPANRQGRIAADHIALGEKARPYPGSIGTAIVRVFDTAAGTTGLSEKRLVQQKIDFQKTIITAFNHAGYYPGATPVTLKILWDTQTGRLLGGQAVGTNDVDKRLDVLATAIRGRMSVEDLEHLELAYAPPFGSAKDPINLAGFSGGNIRDGIYTPVFGLPKVGTGQVLDVRASEIASAHPIKGAVNIPYPQLRSRITELDTSKPVTTVCNVGKTSYFASRILKQHGFDVRSHVGGMKLETKPSKPETVSQNSMNTPTSDIITLDATGLSCPGPILKLKEATQGLSAGQVLEVTASDPGFLTDFPAFCSANGFECLSVNKQSGLVTGRLKTSAAPSDSGSEVSHSNDATLVVFSGELDKAMASLVIANGALAMGGQATLFFTFWGLNVLRKDQPHKVPGKTLMDKMFGWMLPRGVHKLPLSNMHMGGMGTKMMKDRMAAKNLPNLPGLLESAQQNGARFVACTMSMEAMGIREEELIDGIELGGVAEFLGASSQSGTNLFI